MNVNYIWWINPNADEAKLVNKHYLIRSELKEKMPIYHSRQMRKAFINTCETFLGNVEKARIHAIYKDLTGDISANDEEIDKRVKLMFTINDPRIVTDLRHLNEGQPKIYDEFWEYAKRYIEGKANDSVVAIDERRHDIISHIALAISAKDLLEQISKTCPSNVRIPSVQ